MVTSDRLTIVTPTFEKHYRQFSDLVGSIERHCTDLDCLHLIVVIEEGNRPLFSELLASYPRLSHEIVSTESILERFGVGETPVRFLQRIGKFTFQSLKKLGGLIRAPTAWSLVLDSEGVFHKPFSAMRMLEDYRSRKYVFYTRTKPRTDLWTKSTAYEVNRVCGFILAMDAGDRWYMEYFHWFYETAKVKDLVENRLWTSFYDIIRNRDAVRVDLFENILYYLYLEKHHASEYRFIDLKAELDELIPDLSPRFELSDLPFSLFGNEYLLNIAAPSDIRLLQPVFDKYQLPFVRLEPPFFSTAYLPELKQLPSFVATISSHHLVWLRKKIAVCISGEFRHVFHRNPEHNLRHLLGFLSGVECDIYLHGWSNASEALILNELKPRAFRFEARPSMSGLARRIGSVEPNIKPGRDEGSLAMFYGMSACYELLEPHRDEYDYVLRIRPDLFADRSLKELLVSMSDEGDLQPGTIYVPQHFHSKGINDQFALGPMKEMSVYLQTFRWIEAEIERLFFNPEAVLLRHLLELEIKIALVSMPYALMRHVPMRIDTIHFHFHEQERIWWSRTDRLPLYEDLSAYFWDKLRGMEAIMRGQVPPLFYVEASERAAGRRSAAALIRARVVDNDPSLVSLAFFGRGGLLKIDRFALRSGGVEPSADTQPGYLFAYPDGDKLVLSHWRLEAGRLVHGSVTASLRDVSTAPFADRVRHRLGWGSYRARRRFGPLLRRWMMGRAGRAAARLLNAAKPTSKRRR